MEYLRFSQQGTAASRSLLFFSNEARMTETTFENQSRDGIPIVVVVGDVDIANVDAFETALEEAAGTDAGIVIVSLERASYFDSRTIHVLYRFADRLETNRQKMVIVAPSDGSAQRILKITGLASLVAQFDRIDEALAYGAELVRRRTSGEYDT